MNNSKNIWGPLGAAMLLLFTVVIAGCNDEGTAVPPPPEGEQPGMLYVVAGHAGEGANDGDGGLAKDAYLYWPIDATPIESTGELLVVDWNNHRIRKITPDGIIHPFIGNGFLGDGRFGPVLNAAFNHPSEIKYDLQGNIWIAAFHNWCLKRVDPVTMEFTLAVGDTAPGYRGDFPDNNGDLFTGPRPRFNLPSSLVFPPDGFLYFMDQGNSRIRKVDLAAAKIYVFAGGTRGAEDGVGTDAQFAFPGAQTVGTGDRGGSLDLSPDGQNIYIADTENHKIRMINIATQMVTTIAGVGTPGWTGDGGPALSAELNYPTDLVCTANGDLYIADMHNHVVRKFEAATGILTTVAGSGSIGVSPDGIPAREAKFYQPVGVAYNNTTKTLYIADQYNHQLRKLITE